MSEATIYHVGNHRRELLTEALPMREAYDLANARGLVVFTIDDETGKPQLVGDDPLLRHKLGNQHCLSRLPALCREVFSTVNRNGGGFHKLPRNVRRVALAWAMLINQEHREAYFAVMCGPL